MFNIGKLLIYTGLLLAAAGLIIVVLNRIGINPGKLPGDIIYKKGHTTVYFPIVTCIVISVILSILFWIFKK